MKQQLKLEKAVTKLKIADHFIKSLSKRNLGQQFEKNTLEDHGLKADDTDFLTKDAYTKSARRSEG